MGKVRDPPPGNRRASLDGVIREEPGGWQGGVDGSKSDRTPLGGRQRIERGARRGSGTEQLETKVREMVSKGGLKRQAVRCSRFEGLGSLENMSEGWRDEVL